MRQFVYVFTQTSFKAKSIFLVCSQERLVSVRLKNPTLVIIYWVYLITFSHKRINITIDQLNFNNMKGS